MHTSNSNTPNPLPESATWLDAVNWKVFYQSFRHHAAYSLLLKRWGSAELGYNTTKGPFIAKQLNSTRRRVELRRRRYRHFDYATQLDVELS